MCLGVREEKRVWSRMGLDRKYRMVSYDEMSSVCGL